MRKLRVFKAMLVLCVFSIFAVSCSKDGAPGPTGPQGPAGNANVKSVTFDVAVTDWIYDTKLAYVDKNITDITSDIYNKGSVVVYWQILGNWVALPYEYPKDGVTQTMNYSFNTGKVTVFATNSDGSEPSPLGTGTYKAVITAGS